ncbi:MAG: hypothetical protein D6790_04690 [Caldilineae bacterium]|nr:MAG: hypothetical protein D6790_04690 [Caldilineae bacterium]
MCSFGYDMDRVYAKRVKPTFPEWAAVYTTRDRIRPFRECSNERSTTEDENPMYPSLAIGPISLPTAQFFALLAAWFGLSVLAQTGSHRRMDADSLWNLGFIMLAVGLIVARFWHVVQFWSIYRDEPLLIISPRPGGFALGAGLAGAVLAGYAFLVWRRLNPVQVAAPLAVALLAAGAVLDVSAFLTGSVVGTPTNMPWGLPYFGEVRHPVALYRAGAMLLLALWLYLRGDPERPGRVVMQALLGYGLIRLVADGFLADPSITLGGVRTSQLVGLLLSLAAAAVLHRME